MGADLYIRKITNEARDKFEPKFNEAVEARDKFDKANPVPRSEKDERRFAALQAKVEKCYDALYPEDGYFRDSYNFTSVMAQLGLSWWRDVIPMLNKKDCLTITRAKALAQRIEEAPLAKVTAEELKKNGATVDNGENSVEEWNKYYSEKRDRLVRFLRHAVEIKEPIYCSL